MWSAKRSVWFPARKPVGREVEDEVGEEQDQVQVQDLLECGPRPTEMGKTVGKQDERIISSLILESREDK